MIEELYGILREHVAIRLALWNCLSLCFSCCACNAFKAFAPALFPLLFCLAAFAPESMLLLAPEAGKTLLSNLRKHSPPTDTVGGGFFL